MTEQNELISRLTPPVNNPLLTKIQVPGKIVTLPSVGLMYTDGELTPNVQRGEIHVRPISAITELKLKNPDMLFSGKAFDEAVHECCPDVTKPSKLFAKDVDTILCQIRMVSYGSDFVVDYVHDCDNAKQHKYNVDLEQIVNNAKPLTEDILKNAYRVELDNGQIVILEPIRLEHVIETLQVAAVSKDAPEDMSQENIEKTMIAQLLSMINNVDNITDKKMIGEWLTKISSKYINQIADKIESSNNSWGINFEHTIQCKDCGEAVKIDLPINPITFFSE